MLSPSNISSAVNLAMHSSKEHFEGYSAPALRPLPVASVSLRRHLEEVFPDKRESGDSALSDAACLLGIGTDKSKKGSKQKDLCNIIEILVAWKQRYATLTYA